MENFKSVPTNYFAKISKEFEMDAKKITGRGRIPHMRR